MPLATSLGPGATYPCTVTVPTLRLTLVQAASALEPETNRAALADLSLRKVPAANRSWGGDRLYQYKDVDVSVAVAIPEGLITPIIRRADQKGLVAAVSDFLYRNEGNIIHADQHTDIEEGVFLQRVEWELRTPGGRWLLLTLFAQLLVGVIAGFIAPLGSDPTGASTETEPASPAWRG